MSFRSACKAPPNTIIYFIYVVYLLLQHSLKKNLLLLICNLQPNKPVFSFYLSLSLLHRFIHKSVKHVRKPTDVTVE
jgi:hypothetical protein